MAEKTQVKPHKRTTAKGRVIEVEGYERIKAASDKKKARHPAQIDSVAQVPIEKGTKIISRDPDKLGSPKPLEGVQILGRNTEGGVRRVR